MKKKPSKKPRKPEFLLIKGTVFPFDVLFSTASEEKISEHINNEYGYTLSDTEKKELMMTGDGRTVQLSNGAVIVRVKKEKISLGFSLSTLVHELSHATFFILDRVGIEHTLESDEVFAYLQAHLLKEVLSIYDK